MDEPPVLIKLSPQPNTPRSSKKSKSRPAKNKNEKECLIVRSEEDLGEDAVFLGSPGAAMNNYASPGTPISNYKKNNFLGNEGGMLFGQRAASLPNDWKSLFRDVMTNLMNLGLKDLGLTYAQQVTSLDKLYESNVKRLEIKIQNLSNESIALKEALKTLCLDYEKSIQRLHTSTQNSSVCFLESLTELLFSKFDLYNNHMEVAHKFAEDAAALYGNVVTGMCVSLTTIRENWQYYVQQIQQDQIQYYSKVNIIAPTKNETRQEVLSFQTQVDKFKDDYIMFLETFLKNDYSSQYKRELMGSMDLLKRAKFEPILGVEYDIVPSLYNILTDNQVILDKIAAERDPKIRSRYQQLKNQNDTLQIKRQKVLYDLNETTQKAWNEWNEQYSSTATNSNELSHLMNQKSQLMLQLNNADKEITKVLSDTGALITASSKSAERDAALEHRYKILQPFYRLLENSVDIYGAGGTQSKVREFYYRAMDIVENETKKMLQNIQDVAEVQAYDAGLNWSNFFYDNFGQYEYQMTVYENQLKQNEQQIDNSYAAMKKEYLLEHASQPTIHMDLHRIEKICKDYGMTIEKWIDTCNQMTLIQCLISVLQCLFLNTSFEII